MDLDLSKIKKVFFIGIGGIGISALAKMMKAQGMEVSGLNDEEFGLTLDSLREVDIQIILQKDFVSLPEADLYVYSDAWLFRGLEIIKAAKNTGKPVKSYFEALGEVSKRYKVIAVSGTHGKTTTTAMVADILLEAGQDPTVVVGSFAKKFQSNFRLGKGEYLVVEADEFNRHMLYFHPYVGLITNIEADHLDVYKDLEDIKSAFDQFLSQSVHKVTDHTKFLNMVPELKVPGEHNRQNASLALGVADILGIDLAIARTALENFEGTWRRLEKKGVTQEGITVYDDYAHHPTEVQASLKALRELYPNQRLIVVFQPHMYSRTRAFFWDFVKSFGLADETYLLPIFYAREAPDPEVSSAKLSEEIAKLGQKAGNFSDFESAYSYFSSYEFKKGDVFVTMGAGEAYRVADHCLKLV